MYVPDHFRPSDEEVATLLANLDAADLITATDAGLLATFLPLIHEPAGASPDAGAAGRLMGHVARNNLQWKTPALGEALVIVRGPEAYISPSWYETKRQHGKVVPTWNYVVVHAHGFLEAIEDRDWLLAHLADRPARGLPYGTLKRIEIARALAARPKLLMLDEPAAGLTHSEVDELGEEIRQNLASFRG